MPQPSVRRAGTPGAPALPGCGGRLNEAAGRSNRPCPGYPVAVMGNAHVTLVGLTVNGEPRTVMADNRLSLLDLLRERLGLTGTKQGCDHGQCGACTVGRILSPVLARSQFIGGMTMGLSMALFGETAVGPSAAAIGNAVWPATGRRVRDLPITPAKLLSEEPDSAPGGRRGADGSRE